MENNLNDNNKYIFFEIYHFIRNTNFPYDEFMNRLNKWLSEFKKIMGNSIEEDSFNFQGAEIEINEKNQNDKYISYNFSNFLKSMK